MKLGIANPRWNAALAAGVLFSLGALTGVAVDRWWGGRALGVEAAPLTAEAMAAELELDSLERARIGVLLDSLEPAIAISAEQGSDSLRAAAGRARLRLEEALQPEQRDRFRTWMRDQHTRVMRHMRGGGMRRGGEMMERRMSPGGAPRDTAEREETMRSGQGMGPGEAERRHPRSAGGKGARPEMPPR